MRITACLQTRRRTGVGGHDFSRAANPASLVIPSRPQPRLRGEDERGICSFVFRQGLRVVSEDRGFHPQRLKAPQLMTDDGMPEGMPRYDHRLVDFESGFQTASPQIPTASLTATFLC